MTVESQVIQLIADEACLSVAGIDGKMTLKDLDIDSLGFISLIVDAEKKFSIQIDDDEAEKLVTVEDAIAFVKEKMEVKV